MDDGVVVMVDGRVRVLQKGGPHEEDRLRRLLDTRPDLVLAPNVDDHLRLLLASRSATTDDPAEPGALPLERVYVDGEGVPLLVAVQVAPHSPPDGNALLRLLERAATELPGWRGGGLRELVLVTHGHRDEAELLATTLGWRDDPKAFWTLVESRLARERVRVVLVADELPDGLARAVEFLDSQLREVEVRAIEAALYGAGEVCAFVPKRTSGGSPRQAARHAATRPERPPLPQRTALGWEAGASVVGLHDTERLAGAASGGRHRLRD
jgi:hypothetical protein